ncbi:MAG: response regulator [Myxococcota bacterium]
MNNTVEPLRRQLDAARKERDPLERAEPAHILFVEDERSVRKAIIRLLQRAGYQVTALDNGTAALDYWRTDPNLVDLVFTDLVMPGLIDGADLGRRIRANDPDVPIVYCSGLSTDTIDSTVVSERRTHFLAKPFGKGELLAVLASALEDRAHPPSRRRA